MMMRFRLASREERQTFLGRVGVRYRLLPSPPSVGAVPLAPLPPETGGYAVYELEPALARTLVVPRARAVADVKEQYGALFDASFDPGAEVLLEDSSATPAGVAGPPDASGAEIVSESPTEVVVRAGAPEGGGYLVMFDSYHPHWRVTVDDRPADLLRANGLFRAVRLETGSHTVRFTFVPLPFYIGAAITAVTGLALLAAAVREALRRRARRPS